ncbi:hypothetical protein D3C75_1192370 [compost metagenome]
MPENLRRSHAQRQCRFTLPARDAENAGPEDFAQVGPVVQRQGNDAGADGAGYQAHLRQPQVDQQNLDQQRRATEERGVEAGHTHQHRAVG